MKLVILHRFFTCNPHEIKQIPVNANNSTGRSRKHFIVITILQYATNTVGPNNIIILHAITINKKFN